MEQLDARATPVVMEEVTAHAFVLALYLRETPLMLNEELPPAIKSCEPILERVAFSV